MTLISNMLLLALLAWSPPQSGKPKLFEASMNFDLAKVAPFLNQLESHLHLGLQVSDLVKFTRSTAVEAERAKNVSVTFRGSLVRLEYRVFMDDIDAPDLYFITPSQELSKAIDTELRAFAATHGM